MSTASMTRPAPSFLAWALLILLGIIWGSSFMLTNIAVREFPPMTLAALRLALAALLIGAVAMAAGARLPRSRRLWAFALASAIIGNVLPFWLISWSQQHIPSALSGLLMAPMPLISLLLAHFLVSGERMNLPRVIGFCAGFAGIVVLIGPGALALIGGGGGLAQLGQLASLGAMLGYAVNGIVVKRAAAPDALGISVAILVLSALIAAPLAFALETPDFDAVSLEGWGTMIALGVGATATGQILL
ncbi:MAG: DMT family transporter, partial [Pseudomonadota bacterium]